MRKVLHVAAILFFAAAPAVAAAEAQRVEILEFGLYAAGPMTHSPDVNELGGRRWRAQVQLLEQTETIPGQLGRVFGMRVAINDPQLWGKAITLRIRHPRITAPNGRSATENLHVDTPRAGQRELAYFFAFEDTYEIAEGDWIFEVVHAGQVLAAKKFRVIVNMY